MILFGKISAVTLVLILNSTPFKYQVLFYHWSRTNYWWSLQHSIVVLRGEEARKAYFDNKDFDSIEGYKVLKGGVCLSLVTSYQ